MKVTILGCGGAGGVPLIGNNWGACDPAEPRNRRTRGSVLVEGGGQSILIDTSPDMREQLLRENVRDVTAIFYTHAHADHCGGMDDIRSLNWMTQRALPVFADLETMKVLRQRFDYIFEETAESKRFIRPRIRPQVLGGAPVVLGGLSIAAFSQEHGAIRSMGYRIGGFAYSTDAARLDEAAFAALEGVTVWVVGAVRAEPHPTHAHVARVLEWIERVKPERAYLTHMNETMDFATLKAQLPEGVEPAYDGLTFVC